MSFIADVTLEMPLGAPTHEAVPSARATLADYHRVDDETGGTRYVLFLWVTGCDFDAFERATAQDETIESYEAITDSGDRRLYRLRSEPVPADRFELSVFLRDHEVALLDMTRDREGLHVRGQFPTRAILQAFKDAVEANGGWFRLNGLYAAGDPESGGRDLTERQREVLRIARDRGYFETPSQATLAEVADDLDISAQAVSTHIRSAVAKLVDGVFQAESPAPPPRL